MVDSSSFNYKRITELLETPFHIRTDSQNLEISQFLHSIRFLSELREKHSSSLHLQCCRYLGLETFSKNQYIYEKDDIPNKYYIILKGKVLISQHLAKTSSESELSASSEEDEEILRKSLRSRSRRIDIQPEVFFKITNNINERKQKELINENLIEEESRNLLEFIMRSQTIVDDDEKEIKTLEAGSDFGQDAFFYRKTRRFNAVARSKVRLAVLSKVNFRKVLNEISKQKTKMTFEYLKQVSIFSRWSRQELVRVLSYFKSQIYCKGQYVYKEGESSNFVYFVVKGDFTMTRTVAKAKVESQTFDPKSFLRKFEAKKTTEKKKIDLALKGPKEILGIEEVLNGIELRENSCVCNTATAELFCVGKTEFLSKLLKQDTANKFSVSARVNSEWLNQRSILLQDNKLMTQSFERPVKSEFRIEISEVVSPRKPTHKPKAHSFSETPENIANFLKNSKIIMKNFIEKKVESRANTAVAKISNKKKYYGNNRLAPPNFLISFREKSTRRKSLGSNPEACLIEKIK